MAFTLEQNVQGAAAYQQAIAPTSNTGLSLAGNLLEGLDTFARSQVRQEQALVRYSVMHFRYNSSPNWLRSM